MKLHQCWSLGLLSAAFATAAEPPKPGPPVRDGPSPDELYQSGKELFDALAPAEIKEQFEFPDKAKWEAFAARLQQALENNQLEALAQFEPEAREVLTTLQALPGTEDYIDWLEERLDYIEVAKQTTQHPPSPPAHPGHFPVQVIPYYDLWLQRLQGRPRPARADQLIPVLSAVFTAAGLPAGLVWLAEVESTLNPTAHSPSGARGLFQLMPGTARELGLSTLLPDERTDPKKSAQAAARLLRSLHAKFGDWALALAAYNAGAGRVQRTLEKQRAGTYAEIASALPAETRMYVPKVLATLVVRANLSLLEPAPAR
jgi:membrane-bound lytic murein transglycosylase D